MPSDWIRAKAEQESKAEAEAREYEEKQRRDAEIIRSLGPKLVEKLRRVIDEDIVAWNEAFKDRPINGTSPMPDGFSVAKIGHPRGSANITFNSKTDTIDVLVTRSTAVDPNRTYDMDGHILVKVTADGRDLRMETRHQRGDLSPAGLSRIILESIADPNSHHVI